MVSNYVKKGIIGHPIKKKYTREQLAGLIYIVVSKTVLSMENIDTLFKMQRQHYSAAQAYDYFCEEVENCLPYVFGLTHTIRDLAADAGEEKLLLRSTIIAAVNKMFLDCAFAVMHQEQALWPDSLGLCGLLVHTLVASNNFLKLCNAATTALLAVHNRSVPCPQSAGRGYER